MQRRLERSLLSLSCFTSAFTTLCPERACNKRPTSHRPTSNLPLLCALLRVWTDSVTALCWCSMTLLPHSSNLGFSLAGPGAAPEFTYGAGCLGSASQQAAVLLSNIYIHPIKRQTVAHIYCSEVMSCHSLPPPLCADQGLAPVSRIDQI